MNVIYSFIGKLPEYIIETIYQLRLYYNGDVYLIIDDYNSVFGATKATDEFLNLNKNLEIKKLNFYKVPSYIIKV